MKKEIYFCVDKDAYYKVVKELHYSTDVNRRCVSDSYQETENALNVGWDFIVTISLAHLSFDLLDLGYEIFLCKGNKKVKIEPHMDLSGIGEPCKDLRKAHNIFKMFRAGIFDELLKNE